MKVSCSISMVSNAALRSRNTITVARFVVSQCTELVALDVSTSGTTEQCTECVAESNPRTVALH